MTPSLSVRGAHIVLVGLPGAGKSTVGAALSHKLRREFLDFDVEIARRTAMSIPDIFALEGESAFRRYELALTRELVGLRAMILAPGGGWITIKDAVGLLRPPSLLVHLRVTPEFALRRVLRSPRRRPLFSNGDASTVMQSLWETRSPLFKQADFEVDVEALDIQGVTDRVIELAGLGSLGVG